MNFLLLFLVTIFLSVTSGSNFSLAGTYKNQLNSTMYLQVNQNNFLIGSYTSKVGNATGYYPLIGMSQQLSDAYLVSWIVSWTSGPASRARNPNESLTGKPDEKFWTKSGSITAWNGLFWPDTGVLYAQWHLTTSASFENYWQSTLSGLDTFFHQ